jgi:hypothetical protein
LLEYKIIKFNCSCLCLRHQYQPLSQSLEHESLNSPVDTSKTLTNKDSSLPSSPTPDHQEHDGHASEHGHVPERYPVTTVDFSRVETPFIIGIWILFASIAKIGKSIDLF